jgi:DNA-binding transcriptional ArsR family regulator
MLLNFVSNQYTKNRTQWKIFYGIVTISFVALDYNELKIHVLKLFSVGEGLNSLSVSAALKAEGVMLDIHALRMALVRYYKQGLLRRERKSGAYVYSLSTRGIKRLAWLELRGEEQNRASRS